MATERHYQRASNHNKKAQGYFSAVLKDIIKEHQITTCRLLRSISRLLKDIIKEHQITTEPVQVRFRQFTERHYQRASNHNCITKH